MTKHAAVAVKGMVMVTGTDVGTGGHRDGDADADGGARTHPKRFRNPNVSTMTPTSGHLKNTSRMPPMKHTVPRSFCFRAKK